MPVHPALSEEPAATFVADEKNSIAHAMFMRRYDERVNEVAHDPARLADFEAREHAWQFEIRRNSTGMPAVYPTTPDFISGELDARMINLTSSVFSPTTFQSTHAHFGPTMADKDDAFYDKNHRPSLGDQAGAKVTREQGIGPTPPGNIRYATMFNPDQNEMTAFDGKFNSAGKLDYFIQKPRERITLPSGWRQNGVPLSPAAANTNGMVSPVDPRLFGPDGDSLARKNV